MAHIVTEKCNGCKFTDCVEVCPVACFYELETQLVIHPDECIELHGMCRGMPRARHLCGHGSAAGIHEGYEFNAIKAQEVKGLGAGRRSQSARILCLPRRSEKRRSVISKPRWRSGL